MEVMTFSAFRDELEKIAARKGLKMVRDMLRGGLEDKAHTFAQVPGVMKESPMGSMLGNLNKRKRGQPKQRFLEFLNPKNPNTGVRESMEGPAWRSVSPSGLGVTKLPDPEGAATEQILTQKARIGAIDHPVNTRLQRQTYMKGHALPVQRWDWNPGTPMSQVQEGRAKNVANRMIDDFRDTVRAKTGLIPHDLHGNNVLLGQHGIPHVIDVIPGRPGAGNPMRPGAKTINSRESFLKNIKNMSAERDAERLVEVPRGPSAEAAAAAELAPEPSLLERLRKKWRPETVTPEASVAATPSLSSGRAAGPLLTRRSASPF